ncbi:N-acetyltransferase [Paenibacillus selenitireducens]|uniref:N-acetyltransferase n=1 Tax=Paenibacillus selenitireducens TaxID=1324314 RepID=A0A1T2X1K1_9BACL|nr:N-acetyltransferase [Paenibacillus selenitireducens]OPA73695.1 N-acetyltransferase [Paenibacillus selenitireducens]
MYKLVQTEEELQEFHRIKSLNWKEKGFDMEYAKPNSDQYLFYVDGEAGGTFEFTPFRHVSPFIHSIFDDVITPDMNIVETDSFAVLPKFRGKLGREIICLMVAYAHWNGYTHSIGLSDPKVFKSFNNSYHIQAQRVKEDIDYKGAMAIPTVFHLKTAYDNLHSSELAWYTEPIKLEEGLLYVR